MTKLLFSLVLACCALLSQAQLSGTYTIDPNGSGSSNYTSFTAAAQALSSSGVSGAVVFQVKQGTYTEQVVFNAISGVSAVNNIRFEHQQANTQPVLVQFTGDCTNNYLVQINGADWITFDSLEFENLNTTCSRVFDVTSTSEHLTLQRCTLTASDDQTTSTFNSVFYAFSFPNDLHIEACSFEGGSIGVYVSGNNSQNVDSVTIVNNTFMNQYYQGLNLRFTTAPTVIGNRITSTDVLAFNAYGIQAVNSTFLQVTDNYIGSNQSSGYCYGIHLTSCSGNTSNPQLIANNCVNVGVPNAFSGGFYALFMSTCSSTNVYYNTFNRRGGSTSYQTVYLNNTPLARLLNNNVFSHTNYSLYVTGSAPLAQCDYNNFYSANGNTIFHLGSTHATLAAWQNASSYDDHSVSVDPSYLDSLECRTCNENLDDEGIVISGIDEDLRGVERSFYHPSIGAVELFAAQAFTLGPDSTHCADSLVLEGGEGGQTTWSVNGQIFSSKYMELQSLCSQALTYSVAVSIISSCGPTSDAVQITLVPTPQLDSAIQICGGQNTTLTPCGGNSASYLWSTGATTQSITVNTSGVYELQKTEFGCTSFDSTIVTLSNDVLTLDDVTACSVDLPVAVDATVPSGVSYAWSGGQFSNVPINVFSAAGTYTVTITDSSGCTFSEDFTLTVLTNPLASGNYTESGGVFTFDASSSQQTDSNTAYFWDFGDGATPATSTNVIESVTYSWFPVTGDTVVTVNVDLAINNGCAISDLQLVLEYAGDTASNDTTINDTTINDTTINDTVINDTTVNDSIKGISTLLRDDFKVYPNPTNGQFFVHCKPCQQPFSLRIIDGAGRLWMDRPLTSAQEPVAVPIELPPGLYHYRAYTEGAILHSGKLVVQ